jgi:hypothetical protein
MINGCKTDYIINHISQNTLATGSWVVSRFLARDPRDIYNIHFTGNPGSTARGSRARNWPFPANQPLLQIQRNVVGTLHGCPTEFATYLITSSAMYLHFSAFPGRCLRMTTETGGEMPFFYHNL